MRVSIGKTRGDRNVISMRDIDCRSADLTLDIPAKYLVNLLPITEFRTVRWNNLWRGGKNWRRKKKKKKYRSVGGKNIGKACCPAGRSTGIFISKIQVLQLGRVLLTARACACQRYKERKKTFLRPFLFPFSFKYILLVTRQLVYAFQGKWQFSTYKRGRKLERFVEMANG